MKKSRRRFLSVVAAGAAAAAVAPAADLARAATAVKHAAKRAEKRGSAPAAKPATGGALAAELTRQKASLAQTLKTLREVPLDNGAEPAFLFRPLRPAGGR